MSWFKVDDSLSDHPDVLRLLELKSGGAALGLWTIAGSWCSRHLTNGLLPGSLVRRFGFTKKHADALVLVGLWVATEGGYEFRNWLEYQPSRAAVTSNRDKVKRRVKRHRNADVTALHAPLQTPPPSRPVPTRPKEPPNPPDFSLGEMAQIYRELTGREDFQRAHLAEFTGSEQEHLRDMRRTCPTADEFRAKLRAIMADSAKFAIQQRLGWWAEAVKRPLGVPVAQTSRPTLHPKIAEQQAARAAAKGSQ